MSNLRIYKASAGSGKTFRLTEEYLKLVFAEPKQYKNILAVTFTNKATGEMKSRILSELHLISQNPEKSKHKDALLPLCKNDIKLFQKRGEFILGLILHDYSSFSISTIDSFFQRILRAFAKESGITGGYKVELDTQVVLDEVVDNLMLRLSDDPMLSRWLISYTENHIDEKGNWNIEKDIKKLAAQLFTEQYQDLHSKGIFQNLDIEKLHEIKDSISHSKRTSEKAIHHIGTKGREILTKYNISEADLNGGTRSAFGFFSKLENKDIDEAFKATAYKKAIAGEAESIKWSKKGSGPEVDIAGAELVALMQTADELSKPFYTYEALHKYFFAFGILAELNLLLKQFREDKNTLFISDTSLLLRSIIDDNEAPFIYEKTGTRYRHFLIDEFQDTSGFQWANFKPLVQEALSNGGLGLIVGDVKQSIYRWRGGDLNLLLNGLQESEEFIGRIDEQVLGNNYRSLPNLITFNNTLFENLPNILGGALGNDSDVIDTEMDRIRLAYDKNMQETPAHIHAKEFKGFVEFTFESNISDAENDDENGKWKDQVLRKLPALIKDLQDRGYKAKDIAFLSRTSGGCKLVAEMLMDEKLLLEPDSPYNFDFISGESLKLNDNAGVRLLLSIFKHLSNPQDSLALAQVLSEYLLYVKDHENADDQPAISHIWQGFPFNPQLHLLPEAFNRTKTQLLSLPLYELTEHLIEIFQIHRHKNNHPFLLAFQEIMMSYSKRFGADLLRFMDWWEENKDKQNLPTPEDADAMQIMTIHKSKGLEYRVVIIPFCDWSVDHSTSGDRDTIVWADTKNMPHHEHLPAFLPVKYSSRLEKTFLAPDYLEERQNAYIDSLNMLYVALTRAQEALYCFAELGREGKKLNKISDAVLQYFRDESHIGIHTTPLHSHWNEEEHTFQLGTLPVAAEQEHKKSDLVIAPLTHYPANQWKNKLQIKRHAASLFSDETSIAREQSIDYGKLVHGVLASIRIPGDSKSVLQQLIFEGKITEDQRVELQSKLDTLFRNPVITSWFSAEHQAKTERTIVTKGGKTKIPDRVIIHDNKAVVIDFKTGKTNKSHGQQVKDYAQTLKEMGYENIEAYLLYIADEMIERVI